jgi:alpha-mannosidase
MFTAANFIETDKMITIFSFGDSTYLIIFNDNIMALSIKDILI